MEYRTNAQNDCHKFNDRCIAEWPSMGISNGVLLSLFSNSRVFQPSWVYRAKPRIRDPQVWLTRCTREISKVSILLRIRSKAMCLQRRTSPRDVLNAHQTHRRRNSG